jgi:hypothetical protein
MLYIFAAQLVFLWASFGAQVIGRPGERPGAVHDLARQAAPCAAIEYCGALTYGKTDYYLFVLEQNELSGLVLIGQKAGSNPVIADADTSLSPSKDDQEFAVDKPVLDGVEILLRKRNRANQILQRLRTGPAIEVEPRTAPPGSIIVSPTCFSRSGPVYLGHAGIVGREGSIYSADARFGGAWTKTISVAGWLKRFSQNNGCFAFVMRAAPVPRTQNF